MEINNIQENIINILKYHNNICISEIEELLETFEDLNMLNRKGKLIRKEIWKVFIKDTTE